MNNPSCTHKPRLTYVVTVSVSAGFFFGQVAYMVGSGWDVDFVSSPGPDLNVIRAEGARVWDLPIEREIAPLKDIVSLWRLWQLFRRTHPNLVVAGTPKAGLLGTLAARLAGVPHVVYTMHGLRLETALGWKRKLLIIAERVACRCAHRVHCVSPSLRARSIGLGLVKPDKAVVVGPGTCNGVDVDRFRASLDTRQEASDLRRKLGLHQDAPVIGFVGRFTRDKGIPELYRAFASVRERYSNLRLLLVGDFEPGDPIAADIRRAIENDREVIRMGFVPDAAPYYHLMDICVLPTYREGFPGVPLEAQAAEIPVVTTQATGAIDSVLDGQTGFIVPVGDVNALSAAIDRLLGDPSLRKRMGEAGRVWVEAVFRREIVWAAYLRDHEQIVTCQDISRAPRTSDALRSQSRQSGWRFGIKSVFDRSVAACGLIILSPVFIGTSVLVWLSMGRPILFRQRRPGRFAKPFMLLKFRTMSGQRDAGGKLLPDAGRLTPVGRLLRATSLDELPQLWNVFRGDISLVGPRPLLMEYLPRYSPEQARRHDVLLGITGWAQINGRNALTWQEKFALDTWYVDNWSLMLDFSILAKTLLRVLRRDGISSQGHATMPEFMGSPTQSRRDGGLSVTVRQDLPR